MATQTVRTIYEAVVNGAQRNLSNLGKETNKAADAADKLTDALDQAGKSDVKPKIDVQISDAEKDVKRLRDELDKLEANPVDPVIRADVADSEKRIAELVDDLERLERMEATPEVVADTAKAEAELEGLMNRIETLNRLEAEAEVNVSIDQARSDLDRAEAQLKALQGAKAEMVVTVDADSAAESLEGLGDAAEDAGDSAGARAGQSLLAGLNSTPVVGAVAGLVAAVGGYIASGVIGALLDGIRAEDVWGASTGLDEGTARKFGIAAGRAYADAWGESVESNMGRAQKALENGLIDEKATGRQIQEVISQLSAVEEVLGVDVAEAAEAAGNMIKNGLAANAEEAFDVIIRGQQEGLNRSGDWIDTLREYSSMFESLGLTGAESGALIGQAMEAGARNSDVAADALKEFSIRAQDNSKTTRDAFQALGLDADEMGAKIAKGGDDAKGGLDQILDGLRNIEDPMARNAAGVALFGTMWEDMGNGAGILAMDLDNLGDAWVNVGDTTEDAMQRMSDNSATALEKAKRTVTEAATNLLGGLASSLEEPIAAASGYVSNHSADIVGFLIDIGNGFFELAKSAVEFAATTVEVMGDVAGSVDGIVDGVGKTVEAFGHLTGDQSMIDLGLSIQGAADDMGTFSENADDMANTVRNTALPAIQDAQDAFNDWSAGAVAQAEINDAINGMISDVDAFVAHVDALPGGTVTINGDVMEGEAALNAFIEDVANSDGTVTIDGETYPAAEAYEILKGEIAEGKAEFEIHANTAPAEEEWHGFTGAVMSGEPPVVPVDADTTPAQESVSIWGSQVGDVPAKVYVEADMYYAETDLRNFQQAVNDSGGTVTINGDTATAVEAKNILLEQINRGQGTVMINGSPVPAEGALLYLTQHINSSEGTVTIDGDAGRAFAETAGAKRNADNTTGTMDIAGDNSRAKSSANDAQGYANTRHATIKVSANASSASSGIDYAARTRYTTIRVSYSVVGGVPQMRVGNQVATARANGGRIATGLAGGGVVPGPYPGPGVDNVLWPLKGAATGRMLDQPLAGGEWVINPVSSAQHNATLAAINAGATRAELAASLGARPSSSGLTVSQQINGLNAYEVARESTTQMRHVVREQAVQLAGG